MPAAYRASRLSELLRGMVGVPNDQDCEVRAIEIDSRRIRPGSLFIAMPGMRADGRTFIPQAIAGGASAIVYEARNFELPQAPLPVYGIAGLQHHLGTIADRFFGSPSQRLIVIGVTGTNGKTTCTQLLAQALDRPPRRCAVVGTLGYGFPGALNTSLHTTPDAVTLQRLLAEFLEQQAAYVSMEVSSHALDQGRVNAVAFDVAVFTNLSRDHLDYHGDMATYGASKAGLFEVPGLKYAVVNRDDAFGRELLGRLGHAVEVLTYGLDAEADVSVRSLRFSHEGLEVHAVTPRGEVTIQSPLFGAFNAANLLAVLATLLLLGIEPADAARRLSAVRPVPGRVERFGGGSAPIVVVDYAHTPDALEQVLNALRQHTRGRLYCVFGCGGDRDRGKRPQMGDIAERLADRVVLTDDNPRHEAPDRIIAEIRAGMRATPRVIRERRTAIERVIAEAAPEDTVLIAGKGHEDYQQIGDTRIPYSDRDTVRELLVTAPRGDAPGGRKASP